MRPENIWFIGIERPSAPISSVTAPVLVSVMATVASAPLLLMVRCTLRAGCDGYRVADTSVVAVLVSAEMASGPAFKAGCSGCECATVECVAK